MGEIAEMMADGTLCQTCGVLVPGDPPGHPRTCRECVVVAAAVYGQRKQKGKKR